MIKLILCSHMLQEFQKNHLHYTVRNFNVDYLCDI